MFAPFFVVGQTITDIVITDSIQCAGDPECVDITFTGLDNSQSYNLKFYDENDALTGVEDDFTNLAGYTPNNATSGTFEYCFSEDGFYRIELLDASETLIDLSNHTTQLSPFSININISPSISFTDLLCNGDTTGCIKINIIGGTQPYSAEWTGPNGFSSDTIDQESSTISNLSAGTYFLNIIDANDCPSAIFTQTVTEPDPITNFFSLVEEKCFDSNDAELTANPNGGNGIPYSFSWNTGDSIQTIITGDGDYSLTIEDSEGCVSEEFNTTLSPIPLLTFTNPISVNNATCFGEDGSVTINASGGTGVIEYLWPTGTSTINTESLPADDYEITITDANLCDTTAVFTITEPDDIQFNLTSVTDIDCYGEATGRFDFEITGGNPNYSIEISGENTLVNISSNNISESTPYLAEDLLQDTYEIIITDTDGCTNTSTVTVNEASEIIDVNSSITHVNCFGESNGEIEVTIQGGSGAYQYTWTNSNGDTIGQNFNILPEITAGNYNLNINDGLCEVDFTYTVDPSTAVQHLASNANDVSCFGANDGFINGTQVFGGTAPYSYTWTNLNGQQFNTQNPNALSPSTYFLSIEDANECVFDNLFSETIDEPTPITIQDLDVSSPSCFNESTGEISYNVVGGEPSIVGGSPVYPSSLTETSSGAVYFSPYIGLPAGNYILSVNDQNCSIDTNLTLDNPDQLSLNIISTDITCFGANDGVIIFDYLESPTVNSSIEVTFPNGSTSFQADTVENLPPGNYVCKLIQGGCEVTETVTINEPTQTSYNLINTTPTSCNEADVLQNQLISNGTISFVINGSEVSYQYVIGDDTTTVLSGFVETITNLSAGDYEINVLDSICSFTETETVLAASEITISDVTTDITGAGNSNGAVDLTISGGQVPYDISWIGPNGYTASTENISDLASGNYTVTVQDDLGCIDVENIFINEDDCNVTILPNIVDPECPGDSMSITFSVVGGIAPYNCDMTGDADGDGSDDLVLSNVSINSDLGFSITLPTDENFELIVVDDFGCQQSYNFESEGIGPISVTPTINNVSCFGLSDGEIIIDPLTDISGGTAPYTISYGSSNPNPANLPSDDYVITITDSTGVCSQSFSYFIDEPTPIELTNSIVNNPNCVPNTNTADELGSIIAVASGGTPLSNGSYIYDWSFAGPASVDGQTLSDLGPNQYSVEVTDNNECQADSTFTLSNPNFINYIGITSTNPNCSDGADGSFVIETSNADDETFNWFEVGNPISIGNNDSISNLSSGVYSFTITNNQNCFIQSNFLPVDVLTLTDPDPFTFNVISSPSVPFGICDGTAFINPTDPTLDVNDLDINWSTGDNGFSVDSLCSGNYFVEVTDPNGCFASELFTINQDDCNFSLGEVTTSNATCYGSNDGQIQISTSVPNQGYSPYIVKLFEGTTQLFSQVQLSPTLAINDLAAGSYYVVIEDSVECLADASITITEPSQIAFSYTTLNDTCFASYDPEVHMTITGGTINGGQYDVQFYGFEYWVANEPNGVEQYVPGNEVISGPIPDIIITDSNSCQLTVPQIVVPFASQIDVLVTTDPVRCFDEASGSANISSLVGGTSPYSLSWYNSDNVLIGTDTYSLNSLAAGDYYIAISDSYECNTIVNFTIENKDDIEINASVNNVSCEGFSDGSITTAVSGGNGGYSYQWFPGGFINSQISNQSVGNFQLTVSDSEGCTKTESYDIENPDDVIIELTASPITCNGASDGVITANVPFNNVTEHSWYLNGIELSPLVAGDSPFINNMGEGSYNVEVIIDGDNDCPYYSAAIELTQPTAVQITLNSTTPTCPGDNNGTFTAEVEGGTLASGSDYSYSLTDLSDNSIVTIFDTFDQLSSGDFSFIAEDDNACSDTVNFTLNEPTAIELNVIDNDPTCYGENTGSASYTIFNNVGAVTQLWSEIISIGNLNDISINQAVSNLTAGNYNLLVTDSFGCTQNEAFTIDQPSQIEVNLFASSSTCANTVEGYVTAQVSNATLPINYLWTINQANNTTQSGVSSVSTFSTDNTLDIGTITLSGYDQNGCLLPVTNVEVNPSSNPLIQAEINVLESNVCNGDAIADIQVNLIYDDNSPVVLPPIYEWYANDVLIDGSNGGATNQLTNLGPGEYYVIVTDVAYGCVDTAESVIFTDPELMSLNITDLQDVECYGDNNGTVAVDVINGIGPNFTYDWNNTMGVLVANDNNNPTNLVAGAYDLVVTDFLSGCTAEANLVITQPDSITFDLSTTDVSCYGFEDGSIIATNLNGGDNNFNYLWTNENDEIISTSNLTDTLSAQTYTVVVSDGNGCSSEDTISILQPEDVTIESNVVNIDCFGANTGSITINNISGGTPTYSYIWENNPSNLNTIFNLTAGTYPLNIIDDEGCNYYFEIEVEQEDEIVIDAVGTFVSCSEGFANIISINGGVSPYDNYWEADPSNTTSTISDLTPGYHSFFVTDALNCIVEDSVLIDGSNDIITNAFVYEEVACHSDSTGSIFVDITSFAAENAPYYYSINDALSFDETVLNNSFYVNDLPIGSYTIFIKDSEDCIDSTTIITITQPDSLFMTTSSTDSECYGDSAGVITVDISGGVGLYDISIDGGSTFIITNSSGQETILVNAGDYDLFVIDENDCVLSELITINQPEEFILTTSNFSDFNGFNTSCFNTNDASFELNISGGVSPFTLDMNGVSSFVTDGDIVDSLMAGVYTLEITDNNECSVVTEATVTAPDDMVLEYVSSSDFNGQNTSCYNSSDGFVITKVNGGVGPFDYSLNNGLTYEESNTINQYQFSNLSSGEYTFSVKDDNDCVAELSYTVTSAPEILPLLTLEQEILCNGEGQASLLASVDGGNAPFEYTLTGLVDIETFNSVESSILIDNLSSGFYELNVTDANGCSNTIASASQIVISEPSAVSYTANVNNISCNNEGNGSVEISGLDGGQSPYNLKFYNAIGVYFEESNLNVFSPALIFESLESESYTLVITDDNDCEFIDTIIIAEPSELTTELDFTSVSCFNGNDAALDLTISGGTSPFAITLNEESYSSDGVSTIESLSAQDYDISIVDASGCNFSSSFTITEPDSLSVETTIIDNVCFGQTNGSIFASVSGGIAPYSYTYTNSKGFIISETNISDNLSGGTYTISVSDSNDCVLVSNIEISEPAEILVSHEVTDESCVDANNGSIITTVENSQGSYELFWAINTLNSIENYGLSPGIYALTIVDSSGCFITDSVTVLAAEEFNVSLEVTNAECGYTNDGQLLILFDDSESHSVQLSNELVNLQTSGSSEILFDELAEGEYNLQVSYNSTCVFETLVSIEASNSYDCIAPEPTFSPNYDGSNDEFMPLNNYAEVVELTIFNRWGAKIFESKSANPSWDGTNLNGEVVPSADYYYIIKFNNPAYNDITGIITLLK